MDKWTLRYLKMAKEIAQWSKDPSTKVGAVVVGEDGQILSQGYNGFPRGVHDLEERLHTREAKYRYTIHAEMNCVYNASLSGVSLKNSSIYVYGLPICHECAKGVIQSGIKRVFCVYDQELREKWAESWVYSLTMFDEAGVESQTFLTTDIK